MAASRSNSKGQESSRNAEVEDCYPECCVAPLTSCACCKNIRCGSWLLFRWRTRMLVEHRYFEWFILFTVLISSLVLVSHSKLSASHSDRFPLVRFCGRVSIRDSFDNFFLLMLTVRFYGLLTMRVSS